MNEDLRTFYSWVKAAREQLFTWAASLPAEVYTRKSPDFAYGSLRNVQAHIADCYLVWVGTCGLQQTERPFDTSAAQDVAGMRRVYAQLDQMLERAFEQFTQPDEPMDIQFRNEMLQVTQRWLILHPITHEFHHKGQMLTMGRMLGWPYPPGPDTDLALPISGNAD
ncbi:hypothetical protein DKM44_10175 [Deinococcus irradiatisoli]|uniref:Damage-inducible protein DinB n=1 Tax=Deinococcus irradiatisoli TaxID=2202254 RepID=A0A2Z3JHS0_9DEIO|nr:DinB family protein [Deinococcus irradiatisoli]AWN23546.1 hypothetical protein DKM44_10175 [Deinococcus irradiatisoli]